MTACSGHCRFWCNQDHSPCTQHTSKITVGAAVKPNLAPNLRNWELSQEGYFVPLVLLLVIEHQTLAGV